MSRRCVYLSTTCSLGGDTPAADLTGSGAFVTSGRNFATANGPRRPESSTVARAALSSGRVTETAIRATGISKAYEGVHALQSVSFELRAGEVHALVGENGAGKTTLIKIVTGAVQPDEGTLERARQRRRAHDAGGVAHARHRGDLPAAVAVSRISRVAENIALALEGGHAWRRVDWPARRRDRRGAARARRRGHLSRPAGRDAQHARAAARRDRQGDRRRRTRPDHGRTDGVADRARGGAALRRHRPPARATASASSTSRTGSRRSSTIADRDHGAARRRTVATMPRAEVVARRSDPADGRPRALGGVPQARGRARRCRARTARR